MEDGSISQCSGEGIEEPSPDDSEECWRAQADEVAVLSVVYPDEFRLLSGSNDGDDDHLCLEDAEACMARLERPVTYQVRVGEKLDLVVEYPSGYPYQEAPLLGLRAGEDNGENGDHHENPVGHTHTARLLQAMQGAIEPGTPCILQCLQAGTEYLEKEEQQQQQAAAAAAAEAKREREEQQRKAREAVVLPPLGDLDRLPRPLLRQIVYEYSGVRERGRLSVASKVLRNLIERRSQTALERLLLSEQRNGSALGHNEEDDASADLPRSTTIDGIRYEGWTLDVLRAEEDCRIRTYHERLWRTQRTIRFVLSSRNHHSNSGNSNSNNRNSNNNSNSSSNSNSKSNNSNSNNSNSHRDGGHPHFSWESRGYVFGCARAIDPLSPAGEAEYRCYKVRAKLRGVLSYDGDVFVGLVHDTMVEAAAAAGGSSSSPRRYFDLVPGGGFGVATEACLMVNLLCGENPGDRHPIEVNLGLKIKGTQAIGYGVPRFARTVGGRPVESSPHRSVYNDGVVWSQFQPQPQQPPNDGRVYLAAAVAHTPLQELDAVVTLEECSEKEWDRQFRVPYEDLWHLELF